MYSHDYVAAIRDSQGRCALVDLSDCLTGSLEPCLSMELFRQLRAATGTIVWPGGYDGLIIRMFHDERRYHLAHLHAFNAGTEAVRDIASAGQQPLRLRGLS